MVTQIGIIGLPQSGKSTVFNALTHSGAPPSPHGTGRPEAHLGTAVVPDHRLERLEQVYHPKKTTPVHVTFVDVAGLMDRDREREELPPELLRHLRPAAAFLLVVRNFESPILPPPPDGIDPLRDMEIADTGLMLADLRVVEARLERVEASLKKGAKELQEEHDLLSKCRDWLAGQRALRTVEFTTREEPMLRGFQFLTEKPVLVVVNSDEDRFRTGEGAKVCQQIRQVREHQGMSAVEVCGKLEMEIAELEEEDARLFREELGIHDSALERVLQASFQLLDHIVFMTGNEKEVRAWHIPRGSTALDAAATVHTDMARGFIKAEVISEEALIRCGSLQAAREQGLLRLEGKEYTVQEGDVIQFRFNV